MIASEYEEFLLSMNKVVPDEYDSPYMSGVDAEYHSPV
jgi:hypothetical protein